MSGALMGMIKGVPKEVLDKFSSTEVKSTGNIFQNIINVAKHPNPAYGNYDLLIDNGLKLRGKYQFMVTRNFSGGTPWTTYNRGIYSRHIVPGKLGGGSFAKLIHHRVVSTADQAVSDARIQIRENAPATNLPSTLIWQSPSGFSMSAGDTGAIQRAVNVDLSAYSGQVVWIGIYIIAGTSTTFKSFQQTWTPSLTPKYNSYDYEGNPQFDEGKMASTTNGTTFTTLGGTNDRMSVDNILTWEYTPAKGKANWIVTANDLISWGSISGLTKTIPTGTTAIVDVLDEEDIVLINDVQSLADLSGLTNKYLNFNIELSRQSPVDGGLANPPTPVLQPFGLNYVANKAISVDWASKVIVSSALPSTAHEAQTHFDIQGSGYIMGFNTAIDTTIQIDGGSIWLIRPNSSAITSGMCMLRFNKSLKICMGGGAPSTAGYFVAFVALD